LNQPRHNDCRRSPSEPATMPVTNAADRSSRNLGAARPVASRPRCRESVSRSHQSPDPMELLRGAARPAARAARIGDDIGGREVQACQSGTNSNPARREISSKYAFVIIVTRWPRRAVQCRCRSADRRHRRSRKASAGRALKFPLIAFRVARLYEKHGSLATTR
jgi:hypothetical protein